MTFLSSNSDDDSAPSALVHEVSNNCIDLYLLWCFIYFSSGADCNILYKLLHDYNDKHCACPRAENI